MENKKKHPSRSNSLLNFLFIIPTFFRFADRLIAQFTEETRLAGRSIVLIVMLAIVIASLLTATWLGILALLFLYFVSLQWSWLLSLLAVLTINLILLMALISITARLKRNLSFPSFRSFLTKL